MLFRNFTKTYFFILFLLLPVYSSVLAQDALLEGNAEQDFLKTAWEFFSQDPDPQKLYLSLYEDFEKEVNSINMPQTYLYKDRFLKKHLDKTKRENEYKNDSVEANTSLKNLMRSRLPDYGSWDDVVFDFSKNKDNFIEKEKFALLKKKDAKENLGQSLNFALFGAFFYFYGKSLRANEYKAPLKAHGPGTRAYSACAKFFDAISYKSNLIYYTGSLQMAMGAYFLSKAFSDYIEYKYDVLSNRIKLKKEDPIKYYSYFLEDFFSDLRKDEALNMLKQEDAAELREAIVQLAFLRELTKLYNEQ